MADLCPICHSEESKYTNNPILTPNGLAGEDYKGICPLYYQHVKELQDELIAQELDTLPEEDRTEFTPVDENTLFFDKKHIFELRQSIEKLLGIDENTTLSERAELLKDYFTLDEDGNYLGTFEYTDKPDKEEWTDINRITKSGDDYDLPYLPDEITRIKAIHIEDLRHPLPGVWKETWNPSIDTVSPESIYLSANTVGNYSSLKSVGGTNISGNHQWFSDGGVDIRAWINYGVGSIGIATADIQFSCGVEPIASGDSSKRFIIDTSQIITYYRLLLGSTNTLARNISGLGGSLIQTSDIYYKITPNTKLKTFGSFSHTWDGLGTGQTIQFVLLIYGRDSNDIVKDTVWLVYSMPPSLYNPTFEIDWSNMERNLYNDILVIHPSYNPLYTYRIERIKIVLNHRMGGASEDNIFHSKLDNFRLVLDKIIITK